MRQPEYLRKGDKIYMVAPSFGVTIEPYASRYDASIARFKKEGYSVIEGENVRLDSGVAASASAQARAKEINEAFASDAKLILSVGGGETMVEILPYVDFEAIKNNEPKWFMGFSDNTNLTLPLVLLTDTVSIYGPCAPQFFQKKWRLCEADAFTLLQGGHDLQGYPKYSITKKNENHPLWGYRLSQPKVIRAEHYHGMFEGIMLGGCLDCVLGLVGTPYGDVPTFMERHRDDGAIFFFEAYDLNPLDIRRGLFQLRQAGWFKYAKGFLLGRHMCRDFELFDINKYSAVIDILGDMGLPILMDIDLGHIPPSMPIKVGAKANVKFEDGNIFFHYEQ